MPSPFPGMDPFIESQRFDDFHHAYILAVKELLVLLVRPKYVVDAERYVFLSGDDEVERLLRPDVSLAEANIDRQTSAGTSLVATLEPKFMAIPESDDAGQLFLKIRSKEDHTVVSVIELLSPTNKEKSGGMQQYLAKRNTYLRTLTNIVEIDLLRGGTRLPTRQPLHDNDYFAFVIRHGDRAHVEVYGWNLQDRLPIIPVPLGEGDPDVGLDLQVAFDRTYDRGGYDYALDYQQTIIPALNQAGREWVEERLRPRPV